MKQHKTLLLLLPLLLLVLLLPLLLLVLFLLLLLLFSVISFSKASVPSTNHSNEDEGLISKTIVVDKRGIEGNFTRVQDAIMSVPDGNSQWIKIRIMCGVYRERVVVPREKGFIYIEGEGGGRTSIEWGGFVFSVSSDHFQLGSNHLLESAAFVMEADNVIVKGIDFKNTDHNSPIRRALAAYLVGDKASFHYCSFIGFQDTLCDQKGRHYFRNCYIEGSVDFIFGAGQSVYENCTLHSVNHPRGFGWITAQGREKPNDKNGFVFKSCNVTGTSGTFLGRAWRPYSRVIFYNTYMANIIIPQGWDSWNYGGRVKDMVYAEVGCKGPGSNMARRVYWEKKLSVKEKKMYASIGFIDGKEWLYQQLKLF